MKYTIILFFSIFILSCTNTSSNEGESSITETIRDSEKNRVDPIEEKDNRTDEEIIKDIKEQYQYITEGKGTQKFKVDSVFYTCPDYPETGEVIYYRDESGIVLIENSATQGDHGGATDQYYLWDEKLFFIYSDESYWTFDAGTMSDDDGMLQNTVDYFTERRYYFDEERIIKCLEKKYEVRTSKKDNPKSNNVHNIEVEATDGKERISKCRQLLNAFDEEGVEEGCIWGDEE